MRMFVKSKIHKAIVTQADLNYEGSITIDSMLMKRANLLEGEQVLVVDNTNGSRLVTYVIPGERDSGVIRINGAAAHLIKKGDEVIIMAFELSNERPEFKKVLVNKNNKFVRYL